MKKVLAILLCSAVLFNTVGFIILFSSATYKWKEFVAEELDKKIATDNLVKIIDNSSVQHINKHEIISGGKLYDIARVTNEKATTILYCYHDNKEESMDAQLVRGIQQNTDNSASQNSSPSKSLVKQAITDYLPMKKMEIDNTFHSSTQLCQYNFSVCAENIVSIIAPPPRG